MSGASWQKDDKPRKKAFICGISGVLRANVACEGCMLSAWVKYDMACLKLVSIRDLTRACAKTLNYNEVSYNKHKMEWGT